MSNYLSKLNVLGTEYLIKDKSAQEVLATLKQAAYVDIVKSISAGADDTHVVTPKAVKDYVDSQIGTINKFDIEVTTSDKVGADKPATAKNMYILYLVPDSSAEAGSYIEWICVRSGNSDNYTYKFEQIGSTKVDLTGYLTDVKWDASTKTLNKKYNGSDIEVHAFGDLADADTAETTLSDYVTGVTSATVPAQEATTTVTMDYAPTNITSTASYTPTGKVSGNVTAEGTITVDDAEKGNFVVKGKVSQPSLKFNPTSATVVKGMNSDGKFPTLTGKYVAPELSKATVQVPSKAIEASADALTETLTLTAVTSMNTVVLDAGTELTAGSANFALTKDGKFPTVQTESVVKSATVSNLTPITFTGNQYNLGFNGSEVAVTNPVFTGTTSTISASGSYDKANKPSVSVKNKANTANVTLTKGTKKIIVNPTAK